MINEAISEISEFLLVNMKELQRNNQIKKEEDLCTYDYNPQTLVDNVFTQIILFQDLPVLKQVGAFSIKESSFYQANIIQQVLAQQLELQGNL